MSMVLSARQKKELDNFKFRGSGMGTFQRKTQGGVISPFVGEGGAIEPFRGAGRRRINPMVGRGKNFSGRRVRFRASKFGARGGIINLRLLFQGLRKGAQSAFEASRPLLKRALLSAGQQSLQAIKEGKEPHEAIKRGARAGLTTAKRGGIRRKAVEGALRGFTGLEAQREDPPEGLGELFGNGIEGSNIPRRRKQQRKIRNIADSL